MLDTKPEVASSDPTAMKEGHDLHVWQPELEQAAETGTHHTGQHQK